MPQPLSRGEHPSSFVTDGDNEFASQSGGATSRVAAALNHFSLANRRRIGADSPPPSQGGSQGRSKAQLFRSYAPDWIGTLLLAFMLGFVNKAHGFRREFSLLDTSLQHTHSSTERVPMWLLITVAVISPAAIQAVLSLGVSRSFWDFHASLLGLVLSHAITTTTTTVIKVCAGRPRPDLIARCAPPVGAHDAIPFGLVTDDICTTPADSRIITDGFRSFPSGHTSTAFAGLTFLSLYLAGKFHLFSSRKGHAGVVWVVIIPLVGATLVAISRTMDYRHHPTDVLAGALLGISVSLVTYHMYFPPLFDADCHKPWAPRIATLHTENSLASQSREGLLSHSRQPSHDVELDLEAASASRSARNGNSSRPK